MKKLLSIVLLCVGLQSQAVEYVCPSQFDYSDPSYLLIAFDSMDFIPHSNTNLTINVERIRNDSVEFIHLSNANYNISGDRVTIGADQFYDVYYGDSIGTIWFTEEDTVRVYCNMEAQLADKDTTVGLIPVEIYNPVMVTLRTDVLGRRTDDGNIIVRVHLDGRVSRQMIVK